MKLSALRVAGFKSFADPIELRFDSDSIGLVGPNGCGKSNIIDAIRWVMGESRASLLRQENSSSILFNGSDNRPPADWCSVELRLENDGSRDLGMWNNYRDLAVKRQFERGGESCYFINAQRVRRRDVVDLFASASIGAHSYCVVEQEHVHRVVRSEPKRLRAHLEVAAGVAIYKDRRREAEGRLEIARANLSRLNEQSDDLQRRIDALAKQAKMSVKARDLQSQVELGRKLALLLQIEDQREKCSAQEKQAAVAAQVQLTTRSRLAVLEHDLSRLRAQRRRQESEHSDAQGAQYAALAELESLRATRREIDQAQERDLQAATDAETAITRLCEAVVQIDQRMERLTSEAVGHDGEVSRVGAEMVVAKRDFEDGRKDSENAQLRVQEADRAHATAAQGEHAAHSVLQLGQQRLDDLKVAGQEARRELAELPLVENQAEDQLNACRTTAAAAVQAVREGEAELARLSNDRAVLREEMIRQQAQLGSFQAERELLVKVGSTAGSTCEDWEHRQGLDQAPRFSDLAKLSAPGCERAVDSGLARLAAGKMSPAGASADGWADLPEGLTYIEEVRLVQDRDAAPSRVIEGLEMLADKVIVESEQRDRIKVWLRGKYYVASVAEALAARARLESGEEIHTREGVCVGPDYIHGPPRLEAGLEWSSRLRRTDERMARLGQDIAQARQQFDQISKTLAECDEACTVLRLAQQEAEQALGRAEAESVRRRHEDEFRRDSRRRLSGLLSSIESDVGKRQDELEKLTATLSSATTDRISRSEAVATAREIVAEATIRTDSLRTRSKDLEGTLGAGRQAADHCRQRVEDLRLHRVEHERQIADTRSRLDALRARLDVGIDPELASRTSKAEQVETAAQQVLDSARKAAAAAAEEETVIEQKITVQRAQETKVADQQRQEQVDLATFKVEISALTRQLDELGGTDSRVEELRAAYPNGAAIRAANERKAAQLGRMGPINYGADAELRACEKAKLEQAEQRDDLAAALASLHTAIERIDKEMLARLKDSFDRLNLSFSRLFKSLFDGGEAHLRLDGDSLLEAGLELRVNPPGKRVTVLQSLSGGEKTLTALAFLFALNELKPPPFCLLDEVDAMLDEVNTARYCKLLNTVRKHMQIILITHNRQVFEQVDKLVGVTQEEPGVSKIVSVRMDQVVDAVRVAETA